MLTTDTLTPRAYLQQARIEAGYASRDIAAAVVHFSPDAIGRHERGDVGLAPADAMRYAEAYQREDVLMHYCAQCPAGKALGRDVALRPLPLATLRISARLRRAASIADRLEVLAYDGEVTRDEHEDFDLAFAFLRALEGTIADYRLWAASRGMGKGRPAATGRPFNESYPYPHCTASGSDCQGRF